MGSSSTLLLFFMFQQLTVPVISPLVSCIYFCRCPTLGPNLFWNTVSASWLAALLLAQWSNPPCHPSFLSETLSQLVRVLGQSWRPAAVSVPSVHAELSAPQPFASPVSPGAPQHFPFVSTSRPASFYVSLDQFVLLLESILLHPLLLECLFVP